MRGYRVPLPLLAFVTCMAMAAPLPVMAQGMRSATDPASTVPAPVLETPPARTAVSADRQVATVQRLLRRLGYLNDADMSRQMDNVTKFATALFLADIKRPPTIPDTETLMQLLFSTAWAKEGWGTRLRARPGTGGRAGQGEGRAGGVGEAELRAWSDRRSVRPGHPVVGRAVPGRQRHESRRSAHPQYPRSNTAWPHPARSDAQGRSQGSELAGLHRSRGARRLRAGNEDQGDPRSVREFR